MTAVGQAEMTGYILRLRDAHRPQARTKRDGMGQLPAGEPHSNKPDCVSPVLLLCTTLNDALDDEPRQRMLPYLDRTIEPPPWPSSTETRSWIALDWLILFLRAPTWLDAAGLPHQQQAHNAAAGHRHARSEARHRRSAEPDADSRAARVWSPRRRLGAAGGRTRRPPRDRLELDGEAAALIGVRKLACDRATAISDDAVMPPPY